jgi:hypothetical protein
MWAVDVVEASHSALHPKVVLVVLAQLLTRQLLKAVGVLGLQGEGAGKENMRLALRMFKRVCSNVMCAVVH